MTAAAGDHCGLCRKSLHRDKLLCFCGFKGAGVQDAGTRPSTPFLRVACGLSRRNKYVRTELVIALMGIMPGSIAFTLMDESVGEPELRKLSYTGRTVKPEPRQAPQQTVQPAPQAMQQPMVQPVTQSVPQPVLQPAPTRLLVEFILRSPSIGRPSTLSSAPSVTATQLNAVELSCARPAQIPRSAHSPGNPP